MQTAANQHVCGGSAEWAVIHTCRHVHACAAGQRWVSGANLGGANPHTCQDAGHRHPAPLLLPPERAATAAVLHPEKNQQASMPRHTRTHRNTHTQAHTHTPPPSQARQKRPRLRSSQCQWVRSAAAPEARLLPCAKRSPAGQRHRGSCYPADSPPTAPSTPSCPSAAAETGRQHYLYCL